MQCLPGTQLFDFRADTTPHRARRNSSPAASAGEYDGAGRHWLCAMTGKFERREWHPCLPKPSPPCITLENEPHLPSLDLRMKTIINNGTFSKTISSDATLRHSFQKNGLVLRERSISPDWSYAVPHMKIRLSSFISLHFGTEKTFFIYHQQKIYKAVICLWCGRFMF
jgi:hypothetical protein